MPLYLVPTPIGNLQDITLRALETLKCADLILCEDTRHSSKLLNHFGIQKPLLSFYSQNQEKRIPDVIRQLNQGRNIALISDGGMPGISDPGYFLVKSAIENNILVVPLPGPSALLTALVASGLPTENFTFLGFLKRKPGKIKRELKEAVGAGRTIIFYESPYRLLKTLKLCVEIFGGSSRACVARELTKKFEEFARGTLDEVISHFNNKEILGEIVVLICPDKIKTIEDENAD
jgi:16S rRNA (cytidine1402-2'-O)-methyltransferase